MPDVFTVWTIYDRPLDFPEKWVLRAHDVPGGPRASCEVADTLDELRAKVPPGLVCMTRTDGDYPAIYEVWI